MSHAHRLGPGTWDLGSLGPAAPPTLHSASCVSLLHQPLGTVCQADAYSPCPWRATCTAELSSPPALQPPASPRSPAAPTCGECCSRGHVHEGVLTHGPHLWGQHQVIQAPNALHLLLGPRAPCAALGVGVPVAQRVSHAPEQHGRLEGLHRAAAQSPATATPLTRVRPAAAPDQTAPPTSRSLQWETGLSHPLGVAGVWLSPPASL